MDNLIDLPFLGGYQPPPVVHTHQMQWDCCEVVHRHGHHMRRMKAIVVMRITVVQRNIMKYIQPPSNVIGLNQP